MNISEQIKAAAEAQREIAECVERVLNLPKRTPFENALLNCVEKQSKTIMNMTITLVKTRQALDQANQLNQELLKNVKTD